MIAKNGSYFAPELIAGGHYIITGHSNDVFIDDKLQEIDVKQALQQQLKENDFDAVIFFDFGNRLYCYDHRSAYILRHAFDDNAENQNPTRRRRGSIASKSRAGRARLRAEREQAENNAANAAIAGSELSHNVVDIDYAWGMITSLLKQTRYRCALVFPNITGLACNFSPLALHALAEISACNGSRPHAAFYIFRSEGAAEFSKYAEEGDLNWRSFYRLIIEPLFKTNDPNQNRVINLCTPNAMEITNLLNGLRLSNEVSLNVSPMHIRSLAEDISMACANNNLSMKVVMIKLKEFARQNFGCALNSDNIYDALGVKRQCTAMESLDKLKGLTEFKRWVKEWRQERINNGTIKMFPLGSSRFLPLPQSDDNVGLSMNLCLMGNPGTGKTEIATLMGRMYYELGLLPQGHLVRRSAADMISPHIGETASLVRQCVQEAMGGVLFIDEAYAFTANNSAHGREAVDQLVNDMTAYQGQFAVVIAGYEKPMKRFLAANQGLASRFGETKLLPDYTPSQMEEIFYSFVEKSPYNIRLSDEFAKIFPSFCESWATDHDRKWGNAREAGNLLNAMVRCASSRMYEEHKTGDIVLECQDVPKQYRDHLKGKATDYDGVIRELNSTIGLDNVKKKILAIGQDVRWAEKPPAPGRYIFHGPPGTGKTHMARIMANLLFRLGVLKRNYVYELTAKQLQHPDPEIDYGKSSGELTLSEIIEEAVDYARGGILFIDEAHQLADDELGEATLRALVPIIERPEVRADTCVILAGYTERITVMLTKDDGLARRFPKTNRIRFDSYTDEELTALAIHFAKQLGYKVESSYGQNDNPVGKRVDPKIDFAIRTRIAMSKFLENPERNYGEAGFIRDTYITECIDNKNKRLSKLRLGDKDAIPSEDLAKSEHRDNKMTLRAVDIPEPFRTYAGPLELDPPPVMSVWDRVEALVGKEEVKTYLLNKRDSGENKQQFYDQTAELGAHFALSGPIGSGRHYTASVICAVCKEIGLIDRSQIIWVGKGDFEAEFVGQTVPKTLGVIERAKGGCLVVQNPSSMLEKSPTGNSFGPEALATIAGAMGNSSDRISIIFIDSEEGMQSVLKSIPELRGRFTRQFTFEDFTPIEMKKIFETKCDKSITFSDDINKLMTDFFINWVSKKGDLGENSDGWCNGKEVDRLVDELKIAWDRSPLGNDEKIKVIKGVKHRYINIDMFPKEYRKYITSTHDDIDTAFKKLESLTGLEEVKNVIKNIKRRIEHFASKYTVPGCYAFVGNPGTGKTKIARIFGDLLRGTGVLSQGQVIELNATQVASDFAQDPESLTKLVKQAKNGILFIDEAPQLAESFAGKAVMKELLTIVKAPEVINNTCFILAGYRNEMLRLLATDPGFESRFGKQENIVSFEDYTPEQLMSIMDYFAANAANDPDIAAKNPLIVSDPEFRKTALKVFEYMYTYGGDNYGNARFVSNFLYECITGMLIRYEKLSDEEKKDPAALSTLYEEDIPEKYIENIEREVLPATVNASDLDTKPVDVGVSAISEELKKKWASSVVFIEVTTNDGKKGSGSGMIITESGLVLTACHIVRNAKQIRVKLYTPGAIGGEHRFFDAVVMEPMYNDLDIALIKIKGSNFVPLPLRTADEPVNVGENISLIGYPGGIEKSGGDNLSLTPSCKDGRIDSLQNFMGYEHAYLGNLGMPGDSGGAVISHQDGRIIGVLQGGTKSGENGKYEQTFFIPIKYVWEKFVKNSVSNSSLSFASIDALEQMQIKIAEELKRRQNNDIQG